MKKDTNLFSSFFLFFKLNFKQSFVAGFIWLTVGVILFIDFYLIRQMSSDFQTLFYIAAFFVTLLYVFISVYLFPVMVHYETTTFGLVKNAMLLSIGQFPATMMMLIVIGVMGAIAFVLPISILFIGSLTGYFVYRICHRSFLKVEELRQNL